MQEGRRAADAPDTGPRTPFLWMAIPTYCVTIYKTIRVACFWFYLL